MESGKVSFFALKIRHMKNKTVGFFDSHELGVSSPHLQRFMATSSFWRMPAVVAFAKILSVAFF